ncbi:unnamed protein product [Rhizophagus irregularis]|nr:unnamed protein product [Rhizophagus irregularis]
MSDSESFSSDNVEFFPTDFPENITKDSDSSNGEDNNFYSYDISSSTLTLDWHVNLSRPIKNNPNSLIFVITLLNEHSGHNLDVSVYHFEASKTFTKPMLKYIEWMSIHGYLKSLAIKRMLKAKYNQKVYNQDLYKVIYKYHHNNNTHGNDGLQVFECLEKCKDDDPYWIIYKDWDHETNTSIKLFWMSPKQQET